MAADQTGSGPRIAFYDRLNRLLHEIKFDGMLAKAPEPFHTRLGSKGIPSGVYFRPVFIGYFIDILWQIGIAWRCEDRRSLARFPGDAPGESTPDHNMFSLTREPLLIEIHSFVFGLILEPVSVSLLMLTGVDAIDFVSNCFESKESYGKARVMAGEIICGNPTVKKPATLTLATKNFIVWTGVGNRKTRLLLHADLNVGQPSCLPIRICLTSQVGRLRHEKAAPKIKCRQSTRNSWLSGENLGKSL